MYLARKFLTTYNLEQRVDGGIPLKIWYSRGSGEGLLERWGMDYTSTKKLSR